MIVDSQNRFKTTPDELITIAIHKQDKTLLQKAIDKGGEINSEYGDKYITFPLIYAIQNEWLEGVRILLENGAKPNVTDCSENNSLELACVEEYEEIRKLLVTYIKKDREKIF